MPNDHENQGRFADLSPKVAQALIRDAVSSGILRVMIFFIAFFGVLGILALAVSR